MERIASSPLLLEGSRGWGWCWVHLLHKEQACACNTVFCFLAGLPGLVVITLISFNPFYKYLVVSWVVCMLFCKLTRHATNSKVEAYFVIRGEWMLQRVRWLECNSAVCCLERSFTLTQCVSFPLVCKSCALRRFSIQPAQQKKIPNRYLGQPSPFTHPHLLKPG